jgi:serine/threonine protein kinase
VTPAVIGHYRITSKLGEGGMGAVYRATDTKLNRDVAMKVLPDAFAADPDRSARFTREAQVLASLNHPNIAAIYGVEEGTLILELVEGPTLAERIARGPMPLDEALAIARQIAEALEYAHEKGIVHRDLKPANVKVTGEGLVKVLDFGLAKALGSDPAPGDPTSSPTLTIRATMAGIVIGTPAYMSPEQAKGKPVDRRADIWAFGVLLAEMLTGRAMYPGETASEIPAAVIMKEPEIPEIGACLPSGATQPLPGERSAIPAAGHWRGEDRASAAGHPCINHAARVRRSARCAVVGRRGGGRGDRGAGGLALARHPPYRPAYGAPQRRPRARRRGRLALHRGYFS